MPVDEQRLTQRKIFNDDTVAAGESMESDWFQLHDCYNVHGLNGLFAGSGTLKLERKVAAVPVDDYAKYTALFSGGVASIDSPFEYGLSLPASCFVKFKATETGGSNSITGFNLYMVQTGRGY